MVAEIDYESRTNPINTRLWPINHGGVFTGVRLVNKSEKDRAMSGDEHSGLWVRGETAKRLLPQYDIGTARLGGIRLLPGGGISRTLTDNFERRHQGAQEVRDFVASRDRRIGRERRISTVSREEKDRRSGVDRRRSSAA